MTEGIIQKILDKKRRDARNTSFSDSVRISMLFDELEQELIKEIKEHQFDTDKYFDDTIKTQLIGDDKE